MKYGSNRGRATAAIKLNDKRVIVHLEHVVNMICAQNKSSESVAVICGSSELDKEQIRTFSRIHGPRGPGGASSENNPHPPEPNLAEGEALHKHHFLTSGSDIRGLFERLMKWKPSNSS